MPRTKVLRKKTTTTNKWAASAIKQAEADKISTLLQIDHHYNNCLTEIRTQLSRTELTIPAIIANKTIGELQQFAKSWTGNTTNSNSIIKNLDVTKITQSKKRRPLVESSSLEEVISAGTSRSGTRRQKTTRKSKSLSNRQASSNESNKYKTPNQKVVPQNYGTITPKMKPNAAQVILRRPKIGEMALSFQGSPLMTGIVMADSTANINIPLEDGRVFTVQPKKGLRISQVPEIDPETTGLLKLLRDNLNKICSLTKAK